MLRLTRGASDEEPSPADRVMEAVRRSQAGEVLDRDLGEDLFPRPSGRPNLRGGSLGDSLVPLASTWQELGDRQRELLLKLAQSGDINLSIALFGQSERLTGKVHFVDTNGLSGSVSLWLDSQNSAIPCSQIARVEVLGER